MLKNPYDRHELIRSDVKQVRSFLLHHQSCEYNKPYNRLKIFMFVAGDLFSLRHRAACMFHWFDLQNYNNSFLQSLNRFFISTGCSFLHKLWRQYGGILLWIVQILRWWCMKFQTICISKSCKYVFVLLLIIIIILQIDKGLFHCDDCGICRLVMIVFQRFCSSDCSLLHESFDLYSSFRVQSWWTWELLPLQKMWYAIEGWFCNLNLAQC